MDKAEEKLSRRLMDELPTSLVSEFGDLPGSLAKELLACACVAASRLLDDLPACLNTELSKRDAVACSKDVCVYLGEELSTRGAITILVDELSARLVGELSENLGEELSMCAPTTAHETSTLLWKSYRDG